MQNMKQNLFFNFLFTTKTKTKLNYKLFCLYPVEASLKPPQATGLLWYLHTV